MGRKNDQILVVDIESTCWEGNPPPGQSSEIIEIGICLLNVKTGEITQNEGIIIRPQHSEVSEFCTQLTTLTPEMVQDGITFEEACEQIKSEYKSKKRPWASYGAYDLRMFENQCRELEIEYPFDKRHLNVKTQFALKHRLSKETGMAGALEKCGIPLKGTHHRGIDDARNIAVILREVLWT